MDDMLLRRAADERCRLPRLCATGKAVIHFESSNKKLLEIKKTLEGGEGEKMELPELQQNVSMQSGQEASAMDKDPNRTPTSLREPAAPACSPESGVLGQRIRKSLNVAGEMQSTQDKLSRKTSMFGVSESVDEDVAYLVEFMSTKWYRLWCLDYKNKSQGFKDSFQGSLEDGAAKASRVVRGEA
ncbi:hypothetical protein EJB05_34868, partial [Eragrostis curvula]